MAIAKVKTGSGNTEQRQLTLGNAPVCQYLVDLRNGRACFVHGGNGTRYVRYFDSLGPQNCNQFCERLRDRPVRVMQPGETIGILVTGIGFAKKGDSNVGQEECGCQCCCCQNS